MKDTPRTAILGTGSYVPDREILNSDLEQLFSAAHLPLIEHKTGVRARRYAAADESTSDLAIRAARKCLASANCAASDVDAIILATSSPDRLLPATAARVQYELGAVRAFAFDLNAVCTGAIYALSVADSLLRDGKARTVLVIAAELYSRFLNPRDFSTYPYFGDGAGAVLLGIGPGNDGDSGLRECLLRCDGSGFDTIQIPAGGSRMPCRMISKDTDVFFTMKGREVYEFAVNRGSEVINELLKAATLRPEDVRAIITHQANVNIIDNIAIRTGIPRDRFFVNLDRFGNTAGASVLLALDHWRSRVEPRSGDDLILAGFGGGLTWGACRYRF